MIDASLDLPSHLRERLANALDSGLLGAPCSGAELRSVLGTRESYAAFAVWDGGRGNVGARKMRTGWVPLALAARLP